MGGNVPFERVHGGTATTTARHPSRFGGPLSLPWQASSATFSPPRRQCASKYGRLANVPETPTEVGLRAGGTSVYKAGLASQEGSA